LYFFSDLKSGRRGLPNDLDWYLQHFRDHAVERVWRQLKSLTSFGECYRPEVRGEATASYAALEQDVIATIAGLNPKLKAIMFIRDPVARAWSNAKRVLLRNRRRSYDTGLADEFRRFFKDHYEMRCGDYVGNIDRWASAIGEDNLFVGWFNDIATKPREVLADIFTFLGIRCRDRYISSKCQRAINPTDNRLHIPEGLDEFLVSLHRAHREDLVRRFGRYA
jgi:hypothetical protein